MSRLFFAAQALLPLAGLEASTLTGALAWHRLAELLIALAYVVIALALLRLVHSGRMVFSTVFQLFGAFLAAGALAHLIGAWGDPAPGLATGLKLLTAVVSLAAAFALVRALPAVVQMPTRAELEDR